MPFCFLVQNFAEIRKSVDELRPKKAIFKMAAAAILNFKKFQFFVTWLQHLLYIPNFIKIGRFFTDIWRFNDFQNGGRPPPWILNICRFCHLALVDMPVLLPRAKCRWNQTINRRVMAKKAIFKMAAAAILNFKKFSFWSREQNQVQHLL